MERIPETSPTQRLESVRAYMTHDCKAVRATAPMSKRVWEASRCVKPGMAKTCSILLDPKFNRIVKLGRIWSHR